MRLLHGTYLQDWLPPRRLELAGGRAARRGIARLRRHRLALVRPAEFVFGHRITRLSAPCYAVPERVSEAGRHTRPAETAAMRRMRPRTRPSSSSRRMVARSGPSS